MLYWHQFLMAAVWLGLGEPQSQLTLRAKNESTFNRRHFMWFLNSDAERDQRGFSCNGISGQVKVFQGGNIV